MANVGHSKLGASGYYRWKPCPGSVAACEGIVSESSIYAEEGVLAHDIACEILLGNAPKKPIDQDMEDAITVYINHITELRSKQPSFEAVEQKLDLSAYHPELYGTADYVAYYDRSKTLHVVDYKHGAGISVDVKASPQLMYYGLGALHANKFPIDKVILTIVQPRCYHPDGPIRSWETDAIEMVDFAATLIEDAKKTEEKNAPLHAGDHCRFCPAQPTCPAAREQAVAVVTAGFSNVESFDPDRLSKAMALIPQIKSWCESVTQFAYNQAMLGHKIPGYKLVDKRATRKWKDDLNVYHLADTLGLPSAEIFDQKLRSPAQLEKLIPKSAKLLLDEFVIKESSGKTLVPSADDREPVAGAIEAMFSVQE